MAWRRQRCGACRRSRSATKRAQRPLHSGLGFLQLFLIRRKIACGQRLICSLEGCLSLTERVCGGRVVDLTRRPVPVGVAFLGAATRAALEDLVECLLQGVADPDRLTKANHYETQRRVGAGAALPLGVD